MSQAQHFVCNISKLERKVLSSGQAFTNRDKITKSHAKEIENLKRVIREITVANDVLKKTL